MFRTWRPADLDLALELWGDPRVGAFITAAGAMTEEEGRQRLLAELELEERHGIQYWPIFLRESGEHTGCCGLRPYDPARRTYEVGAHLRPAFWGRGLASEALRAVMAFAFDGLGASALFAGHNPRNVASQRLLTALGFRYTHDELYTPTGLMHPSYLLTVEEHRLSSHIDKETVRE
jgi:[ribosomal protein S5]-alanine N-acetyltransferase